MKSRRRLIGLAVIAIITAVTSVVTGEAAHATINNPPGYTHFQVWESGLCLTLNADTGAMVGWRCLNAASEEWHLVPVSAVGGPITHTMLVNHWTGQCMAVPNWPVNGTGVVQAVCNENDVRQYWHIKQICRNEDCYHIRSLQGALCLNKPDGNNTQGVNLQMWTCAPETVTLPFQDRHDEAIWRLV